MTVDQRAAEIVAEMTALGAIFEIEPSPAGPCFVWRAHPPAQRNAVAAFWDEVEKPTGLRAAMTAHIARLQAIGGAL